MHRSPRPLPPRLAARSILAGLIAAVCLLESCASPNQANIKLRKEKQALEGRIQQLQQERDADRSRLSALEQRLGAAPTLAQSRLDAMFTVHGIKLGRLTGGTDLDRKDNGEQALKVYLIPLDEAGDPVKATGHLVVEAFDLGAAGRNRVGRWEFSPEALKQLWRGLGPLQAFVVVCPWQTAPPNTDLALQVTFQDALTGRSYAALQQVKVKLLPPAATTRPATRP